MASSRASPSTPFRTVELLFFQSSELRLTSSISLLLLPIRPSQKHYLQLSLSTSTSAERLWNKFCSIYYQSKFQGALTALKSLLIWEFSGRGTQLLTRGLRHIDWKNFVLQSGENQIRWNLLVQLTSISEYWTEEITSKEDFPHFL